MAKWTTDNVATPPMFYDYKEGRKTIAFVRRINGKYITRAGQVKYQHHYQVVLKWVGSMGRAYGPIFTSLSKAKRYAEGRVA